MEKVELLLKVTPFYMGAFKSTGDNYMNMSSIAPNRMQNWINKNGNLFKRNIISELISGFLTQPFRDFTFDYYWRDREDLF